MTDPAFMPLPPYGDNDRTRSATVKVVDNPLHKALATLINISALLLVLCTPAIVYAAYSWARGA